MKATHKHAGSVEVISVGRCGWAGCQNGEDCVEFWPLDRDGRRLPQRNAHRRDFEAPELLRKSPDNST